ncbi:MAG: hypothetical protein AAGI69_22765 [Cyanobacteria bacterium P01_H01_bin.21]
MSSVLPIDTQRYQSGPYILEVTSHVSPLSQWSDRPVVRQLRFSLWLDQQRLAAGDQHQLLTMSKAVETYVQTHLTRQWWPQRHRLKLLETTVELSTLQLFDLAEVLNAYGQRQITLPAVMRRRRSRWWTGSAVASLLVAVGVTTAYLHYRPTAFNQVATSQAPEAVFDEADLPEVSPEAGSAPAGSLFEAQDDESAEDTIEEIQPEANQELAQQPLELDEIQPDSRQNGAPADEPLSEPTPDEIPPPADSSEQNFQDIEPALAEPAPAPETAAPREPAAIAEAPTLQAEFEEDSSGSESSSRMARGTAPGNVDVLVAIATQLAPYQPTGIAYPVVYHTQIAADGQLLSLDPISENAPALEIPAITIASPPGQALQVEITYTGSARPTVRELP